MAELRANASGAAADQAGASSSSLSDRFDKPIALTSLIETKIVVVSNTPHCA
jgi:hypothetical protein